MAPHACHHTATDEAHHGIIGTTIAIFCQPAEPGNGSTWQARYDITQRLRGSPGRYRKAQALVGTLPATHSRSRFARGSEGNTNEKNICPYTGIEILASNASLIFSFPSSLWSYWPCQRDQYVTGGNNTRFEMQKFCSILARILAAATTRRQTPIHRCPVGNFGARVALTSCCIYGVLFSSP